MRVTRRELLIGGLAAFTGAGAGFGVGRVFPESDFKPIKSTQVDIFANNVDTELTLPRLLNQEQVKQVKQAIQTHFNTPLQKLGDFGKTTLDYGASVLYNQEIGKDGRAFYPRLGDISFTVRGTRMPEELGNYLYLSTRIAREDSERISKLVLATDLQHTFGTGLMPNVDKYIDTTERRARIADKDLQSVAQEVFRIPRGSVGELLTGLQGLETNKVRFTSEDGEVEYLVGHRGSVRVTITKPFYTPQSFY